MDKRIPQKTFNAAAFLVALFSFSFKLSAQASVLWVAQDGSGDYTTISEALAQAAYDPDEWREVRVVQGIYTALPDRPLINWTGTPLLLRGGWDRVNGRQDPREFPTILDGQGLPRAQCISIRADHVWDPLEFSGFTIRGCNGGGVSVENVILKLSDLIFEDNHSLSSLLHVTSLQAYNLELDRVRFERNRISGTCGIKGGALFVRDAYLRISDSAFIDNILECGQGGALGVEKSWGKIVRTVFKGNRASEGGGAIYIGGGPHRDGLGYLLTLTVKNSLFWQNTATSSSGQGGAIKLGDSATVFMGNNVLNNFASQGRAFYYSSPSTDSSFELSNSILRNGGDELRITGPMPVMAYNNVQGGYAGGQSIIDADPLFVDAPNGDFHLSSASPCIGKGSYGYDLAESDFYGGVRINGFPDIGMDEFGPLESPPCEYTSSISSSSSSSISSQGSSSSSPSSNSSSSISSIPPGCRWIDISNEKADILLGPGKLKDYALKALQRLANPNTTNRPLYKRLLRSAARVSKKMDQAIEKSLVELAQLPDRILDCPDSQECVSVDNTALIQRHLLALNKLVAVYKRASNRGTRLVFPSIKEARRQTSPQMKKVLKIYNALKAKAKELPARMSKCTELTLALDGQNRPVYWVDPAGHGNFKTIQCAVDLAPSGSEIRVVRGTYTVPHQRELLTWRYKNLALIGGFSAVNGVHNPLTYPTVLDGEDLYRDTCLTIGNVNKESEFSGFTVTGCKGGFVHITDSELKLENDIFAHNEPFGSAVTMERANPRIVDGLFNDNINKGSCATAYGGALSLLVSRDFTISGTIFNSNRAPSGGGGAIFLYKASGLIERSAFLDNIARYYGGALNLGSSYLAPYPEWALPVTVRNSLFTGNQAELGGAMDIRMARASLSNLTIVNNTAPSARSIFVDPFPANFVTIRNVIMRNGGSEIGWNEERDRPTVTYSNVQGGFSGTGNIDQATLFSDPAHGDYRLKVPSPEINAGDPSFVPASQETDFFGSARVQGGRVDIGMHEAQ